MALRSRALALLLTLCLASPASAQMAKELFGGVRGPSSHAATPIGGYSRGCLAGGVALPETGTTWQAMRLSRNRNWGHPETLRFIERLSRHAARQPGWNGLYVGDIAQPRGGPMLTGHASHQTGLDVDVWMLPATRLRLSPAERERISSISLQRAEGASVNGAWSRAHHAILKAAAEDRAVARIFVFAGAKAQMCRDATGDRDYLRKIRPWWGHDTHFHVRLACPRGARGCVDQEPPPPGDGCADAEAWVRNILNPPPPDPNAPPPAPRRLRLADLPPSCSALVSR